MARRANAFEKIVIGPCTLVRTWGTRPAWSETKSARLLQLGVARQLVWNLFGAFFGENSPLFLHMSKPAEP